MSKRARFAALALAIIMLVSAVAAVPLLYRGHSHNCIGENCPVCLAITLIKELEKTLFYAGLSFIFVLIYVAVLKTAWAITPPASVTPVSLNLARVELATLKTAKFTSLFASKLEIRRYVFVFRLRRYEKFCSF